LDKNAFYGYIDRELLGARGVRCCGGVAASLLGGGGSLNQEAKKEKNVLKLYHAPPFRKGPTARNFIQEDSARRS
jgi:hypothetical protein